MKLNRRSKWVNISERYIISSYLWPKEQEYFWGAFNMENCKSANNKNCITAIYRAAKNKNRVLKSFEIRKLIKKIRRTCL